jgi:Fur family transcriptional regulator, ferric uptake regulator
VELDARPPGGSLKVNMNEAQNDNPTSTWLDRLQSEGYRLTAPRQAVVEIIAESRHVLSPLEVFEQARRRYPRIGLVTVYRTVEKLEDLGLIQRVHQPSGCHAFIAAISGHQHLLICEGCGRVEYFHGDDVDELMEEVGEKSGFHIHAHWLQLFGACRECQSAKN